MALAALIGFVLGQRAKCVQTYGTGFSDGVVRGAADQWEHDKTCFMTDAGREAWLRARPQGTIVQ